jgi:hypothetical protein
MRVAEILEHEFGKAYTAAQFTGLSNSRLGNFSVKAAIGKRWWDKQGRRKESGMARREYCEAFKREIR